MLTGADLKRVVRQMAEAAPSLATVLTRWIRRRRLTQVQIAAASGITRSYISTMANGGVSRPSPETLRRLARGVATEPERVDADGTVVPKLLDQLEYEQALRELSEAAGFADLTHEPDRGVLVREIQALGSNLQAADFWRALMEAHPNPSPPVQQMLRFFADTYDRPGGGDVQSLWLLLGALMPPDSATLLEQVRRGLNPQPR
jgi:transcriptional regulator with XRE-family HTH domain